VRIRTKLLALVLFIAGGFVLTTMLSIRTYQGIISKRNAIDGGVRLIAQSRKAHGYMTDLVFDLFGPRLYSSLQGIILAPNSIYTQRQWARTVAEFRLSYDAFMADPALKDLLADEELKTAYEVTGTLSARAFSELKGLEEDFTRLRERFKGGEGLYGRLLLSKDESLYAVFDHVRSASYYLGNIFESYLNRFVGVLEQSAEAAERRALVLYGILSALVTALAVAGVLAVSRSLLANVGRVDLALERISEGDFSSRVAPSGHDEMGLLADRVNLFASRLKDNVDSLTALLGDVNSAIPEAGEIDRILAIVTDALLRGGEAEGAAICLLEGGSLSRSAWSGFLPFAEAGSWEALADACLPLRNAFLVRDAALSPGLLAEKGLDAELRSVLALPLVARDRVEGLCVFGRKSRPFTDLELTQLESFADYAAQVIDNALVNASLRARSDAEYRALQSQIQPHFLYNVLNGFVALNRMGERAALEASLHALKDMLRYTIEHGQRASVREEFSFLEQYCRLQKLRFEERLGYEFELGEGVADLPIPKLLVQPLLENAMIHGIEPSPSPCVVTVSARIVEERLVLEVEDDGAGCDPSAVAERERIGIGNVRERLALLYPRASLTLSGALGSGFKARIDIPLAELDRP
jgi:sensor histidine kinase YesM